MQSVLECSAKEIKEAKDEQSRLRALQSDVREIASYLKNQTPAVGAKESMAEILQRNYDKNIETLRVEMKEFTQKSLESSVMYKDSDMPEATDQLKANASRLEGMKSSIERQEKRRDADVGRAKNRAATANKLRKLLSASDHNRGVMQRRHDQLDAMDFEQLIKDAEQRVLDAEQRCYEKLQNDEKVVA